MLIKFLNAFNIAGALTKLAIIMLKISAKDFLVNTESSMIFPSLVQIKVLILKLLNQNRYFALICALTTAYLVVDYFHTIMRKITFSKNIDRPIQCKCSFLNNF